MFSKQDLLYHILYCFLFTIGYCIIVKFIWNDTDPLLFVGCFIYAELCHIHRKVSDIIDKNKATD